MQTNSCYFCDEPTHIYFISKRNGIDVCVNCNTCVPINNMENGECCVCFEVNSLIKLPNCIHKTCLECCKTIYFGTSANEKPTIHPRDNKIPIWPFDFDDDTGFVEMQYEEYDKYDIIHFDINLTYDELITIRDSLIPTRPAWMNEEVFINYENARILYNIKCATSNKLWDAYNKTKVRGNSLCPLCRA